jgi:hypothetical protein
MDDEQSWLVLVYRVPTEPTRLRAAVWRRLKSLGAIYLQNSVAALPADAAAERALRTLRREIQDMGGTAHLLRCTVLAGATDVRGAFNAARDEEYEEIVDRCRDFLAEIEKETAAEHFTFPELEENDEDLAKLRGWFDKVRARDALGAPGQREARAALESCAEALDGFANLVYAEDSDAR